MVAIYQLMRRKNHSWVGWCKVHFSLGIFCLSRTGRHICGFSSGWRTYQQIVHVHLTSCLVGVMLHLAFTKELQQNDWLLIICKP